MFFHNATSGSKQTIRSVDIEDWEKFSERARRHGISQAELLGRLVRSDGEILKGRRDEKEKRKKEIN